MVVLSLLEALRKKNNPMAKRIVSNNVEFNEYDIKKDFSSNSRIKIKVTSYYNFLELFCKIILLDKNSKLSNILSNVLTFKLP